MSEPEPNDLDPDLRLRLSQPMLDQSLRPVADEEAPGGTLVMDEGEMRQAQERDAATAGARLPKHMSGPQEWVLLPLSDAPEGIIGVGGEGVVYSYVQRELGREVAVKTLRADRWSYEAIESLLREACVTARLEHPNIVPVHHLHLPEHDSDSAYWVMKRVQGKPLTEHLPSGSDPWAIDKLLDVFRRVLDAVAFAHSKGIVHRDLKPDNILVGEFGEVQVTDWGLAVAINEEGARGAAPLLRDEEAHAEDAQQQPRLGRAGAEQGCALSGDLAKLNDSVRSGRVGALLNSSAGGRAGTPIYMAPEQLDLVAGSVDERTDVFLLGGILYAMLTGQAPHQLEDGEDTHAVGQRLAQIRSCSTIRPVTDVRREHGLPDVPEGLSEAALDSLWDITKKALSPEPGDRLRSVAAFETALDQWGSRSTSQELSAQASTRLSEVASHRRPSARGYAEVLALADAALDNWGANDEARHTRDQASAALAAIQRRSVQRLWTSAAAIALAFIVGAVGYQRTRFQGNQAKAKARELAEQLDNAYWEAYKKFELRHDPQGKLLTAVAATQHARDTGMPASRRWGNAIFHGLPDCPRLVASTYTQPGWRILRYSPSGELLVGVADYGVVKLWDASCGREEATLTGASDDVTSLDISPDEGLIAAGDSDGTITLWDAGTYRWKATFTGHSSPVTAVRFFPGDDTLASADDSGEIRLWDSESGRTRSKTDCARFAQQAARARSAQQAARLAQQTPECQALHEYMCLSADGRALARSVGAEIVIWDVANGKPKSVPDRSKRVGSKMTIPDGAKGRQRDLRALYRFDGEPILALCFSPDGRTLAWGINGDIELWDLGRWEPRGILKGHTHTVLSIAFSADGRTLASGSTDGTVMLWDIHSRQRQVKLVSHRGDVRCLAFRLDGKELASADRYGQVKLWDLVTHSEKATLPGTSGPVHRLSFGLDGTTVAYAMGDRTVRSLDLATEVERTVMQLTSGDMAKAAFSHDGKTMAVADHATIKLVGLESPGESTAFVTTPAAIDCMCFTPDGTQIVSASRDGRVRRHAESGQEEHGLSITSVRPDSRDSEVFSALELSPNGRTFAYLYPNSEHIRLRDPRAPYRGNDGIDGLSVQKVSSLKFSPDGQVLAIGEAAGTVRMWDLANKSEKGVLAGHSSAVTCLAFTPDGKRLASGSDDTTVRLWDVGTGRQKAVLRGHLSAINNVAFDQEGAMLASGSMDGTVKVWDIRTARGVAWIDNPWHWRRSNRPYTRQRKGIGLAIGADGLSLAISQDKQTAVVGVDRDSPEASTTSHEAPSYIGHVDLNADVSLSPDGRTRARPDNHVKEKGPLSIAWWRKYRFGADVKLTYRVGGIALSDAATGEDMGTLGRAPGCCTCVCFNHKGDRLASGRDDGTVRLWQLRTREEIATLKGHSTSIRCLRFGIDDRTLVSLSADELRIWDVASRRTIHLVSTGPGQKIPCLGPDGGALAWWEFERGRRTVRDRIMVRDIAEMHIIDTTRAEQLTGNRLHVFEARPLPLSTYVPKLDFAPVESTEDPPEHRQSAASSLAVTPRRCWTSRTSDDLTRTLYTRAIVRERQGRYAEAAEIHQRIAGNKESALREWADKSSARLRRFAWLQPSSVKHARTLEEGLKSGDTEAVLGTYAALSGLGSREKSRLAYRICAHAIDRALGCSETREHELGERMCRASVRIDPKYAPSRYALGVVLAAMNRDEQALEQYRKAIQLRPEFGLAHFDLARLLHERREYEAALVHYEKAATVMYPWTDHRYRFAAMRSATRVLLKLNRTEKAIKQLEKVERDLRSGGGAGPCDRGWHAEIWLAALYAQHGKKQPRWRSDGEFRDFLRSPVDWSTGRAVADLLDMGVDVAAVLQPLVGEDAEMMTQLRERLAAGHAALADHRARASDRTGLATRAWEAVDMAPESAAVRSMAGSVFGKAGMYEQASLCFRKATELEPKNASHHRNLSWHVLLAGRYKEAALAAECAVRLAAEPRWRKAAYWCDLGWHRFLEGRRDQAMSASLHAVALDPTLAHVHANVGLLHVLKRDLNKAMPCYEKAAKLSPNEIERIAIGPLLVMIRKQPEAIEAHYALGFCYEKMGDMARARVRYLRYIGAAKEGEFVELARERAKKKARLQGKTAVAAERDAETQPERALRDAYFANIALAQQKIRDARIADAERALDACPEQLRHWEWGYLKRLCHVEPMALRGHGGRVCSVAFSLDGQRIASGSRDATVKLWDASTGREVATLIGHHQPGAFSVAFSPRGERIASGGLGRVKVWDVTSGSEILTVTHGGIVYYVTFSPDGQRVASASAKKTVKVWDAATGREVFTIRGPYAVFSPIGQHIASASEDNTVRLWDAASGHEVLTIRGHGSGVRSVAFSPDGQRIVSCSIDRTVKLWNVASGREIITLRGHDSTVNHAEFSPDGQRVASCSIDRTVKLWNAASGREIVTLRGHDSAVYYVAFSPDGQRVVSGSMDRTVKLWDAATGREVLTLGGHDSLAGSVAFSPDGHRIAAVRANNTVQVWDRTPALKSGEFLAGAQRGEAKALYHLALVRELEHKDTEARELHQRAAAVTTPEESGWAEMSRWRLTHLPWLQSWWSAYSRTVACFESGDIEGGIREYRAMPDVCADVRRRLADRFAERLVQQADQLRRKQAQDVAERLYQLVLELDPAEPWAHLGLGRILSAQGDDDGAIQHYQRANETSSGRGPAHYELARLLEKRGEHEKALGHWKICAASASDRPSGQLVVHSCVRLLVKFGRKDEAVQQLSDYVQKCPKVPDAHAGLAALLCSLGRYKEAGQTLEPLLSEKVSDTKVHLVAALCSQALGKGEEAARYLKLATEREPSDWGTTKPIADLLELGVELRKPFEGLLHSDDTLRARLDASLAWGYAHGLAGGLMARGEKTEAAQACRAAVRLAPDRADVQWMAGQSFQHLDMHDEAVRCFSKAVELKPDSGNAHASLSRALCLAGHHDEAMATSLRALELDPKLAEGHANVGFLHVLTGDLDKAMPSYAKAAEFGLNQIQGIAIHDLLDLLKKRPELTEAHYALGFCYEKKGDKAKAREHYQKYVDAAQEGKFVVLAEVRLKELATK